jgi:isocitrate dehydrogenase kinase/phosphatase
MLDNVMYDNVALPRRFFGDELAAELLEAASDNVMLQGEQIVFHHLIGQMKMTPLPEFLKTASVEEAEQAISSLGRCIKNNAAANVFNKDLDGRNYGVGQSLKVYLFDYDAVEPLTDIKIRTNADRIEGEEDVPDWFFEDGIIFLPEEIELHLRINDRHLRERFRAEHGDLLQTDFWLKRQVELRAGRVPHVSTYPEECRI